MKKAILFIFACLTLCLVQGCQTWTGGVAPSNIPLKGKKYAVLGEAQGQDTTWYLFGGIPLTTSTSTDLATQRCINKYYGDALIDVTADSYYYFYFILARNVTVVRGKVIKIYK